MKSLPQGVNRSLIFQSSASLKAAELSSKTRDLPRAIWGLMRNGTFMASLGMQTAEAFLLNGFIHFVPKLMKEVSNKR